MVNIWPEIPPDAKQTNCWRLILIYLTIQYILFLITFLAEGRPFGALIILLLQYILIFIIFHHIGYVEMTISSQMIHIDMGPWRWPILRWFFSSQINKEEIYFVENKQRECFYDIIPRLYCQPIFWCCCHKSYNAYWWPFCCNESLNIFNLCDGDSDTTNYIQIALTQDPMDFNSMCFKRCSPCPFPLSLCWCGVYNRIAVSINPQDNLIQQLENFGYPLRINPNVTHTAGFGTGTATTGPNYAQMQDNNNNSNGDNINDNGSNMSAPAVMATAPSAPFMDMDDTIGNGVQTEQGQGQAQGQQYSNYAPPV